MKLGIIFPVMNQHPLSRVAITYAMHCLSGKVETELRVIDNGSDQEFEMPSYYRKGGFKRENLVKHENIGVYPLFWDALKYTDADIIAVFHSDLIINQPDWDLKIVEAFQAYPKLGLIGFIGSNEIDGAGGRGLGTTSNFLGNEYTEDVEDMEDDANPRKWKGSAAEIHGARTKSIVPAAVVDGCAMIFRRSVLEQIPQRMDFPPHHFYDRLLSCEVREKGYDVAVLGIGCDHISGQTVNQEQKYHDFGRKWLEERGVFNPDLPVDQQIYQLAEKQWMDEYRAKGFIPSRV